MNHQKHIAIHYVNMVVFCASQYNKYILSNLCIMTSLGSAGDYNTCTNEVVKILHWPLLTSAFISGS